MNKLLTIVVVVLAVLGLGVYLAKDTTDTTEAPTDPVVGGVSSPDISSPYFSFGGIRFWGSGKSLAVATTTICALPNPVGNNAATSSIVSASFQIDTGTSTAASITIATSTSQYGTTTNDELVADFPVASGAKATVVWRAGGTNNSMIRPGEWLLVRTSSAGLSGYTYGGTCQAVFEDVSN